MAQQVKLSLTVLKAVLMQKHWHHLCWHCREEYHLLSSDLHAKIYKHRMYQI